VADSEVGAQQGGSQRRGRGTPGRWSAARSGRAREVDSGEVEAIGSRLAAGSGCTLWAGWFLWFRVGGSLEPRVPK
jgi:hypothetical protein